MGLSWLPGLSAADVSGHLGVSEKTGGHFKLRSGQVPSASQGSMEGSLSLVKLFIRLGVGCSRTRLRL